MFDMCKHTAITACYRLSAELTRAQASSLCLLRNRNIFILLSLATLKQSASLVLLMTLTCSEALCYVCMYCVLSGPFACFCLNFKCKHFLSQNCTFFDWHLTIKLILCLACLLNINCSSTWLIKKGPTVYHMCPTLIMFTNHTHSPNSTVTLRTCAWGSTISALPNLHTPPLFML